MTTPNEHVAGLLAERDMLGVELFRLEHAARAGAIVLQQKRDRMGWVISALEGAEVGFAQHRDAAAAHAAAKPDQAGDEA